MIIVEIYTASYCIYRIAVDHNEIGDFCREILDKSDHVEFYTLDGCEPDEFNPKLQKVKPYE